MRVFPRLQLFCIKVKESQLTHQIDILIHIFFSLCNINVLKKWLPGKFYKCFKRFMDNIDVVKETTLNS